MKRVKQYLALGLAIFMTSTEVFTTPMVSVAAEMTASVEETSTEETNSEEVVETADEEENVAEKEQSATESESKTEDDTTNKKESESGEDSEQNEIKEAESEEADSETEETETEEITETKTEIEEVAVALFSMDLSENQYINYATEWKYLDNDTDPAGNGDRTSWTLDGFDDSTWKTNVGTEAKFGAKKGAIADLGNNSTPAVLLNQYNEAGVNVRTFFFRTSFALNEIPENVKVVGKLKYDDAAIVYINGKKVAAFDEPTGGFSSNLEYGGSNAGEPKDATFSIDADCLKVGNNVIAVEVHQGREASSDIYFEMSSLELVESETESTVETVSTQKAVALAVGADETSRNITWYADAEVAGKVQYAVKTGDTFPENYTEVEADVQAANETGYYSNQATLGNLAYDTEYVYRLVNGEKVSETYSFKTGSKDSFSFLLAGDPQIGAGSTESDIAGWENTLNLATEKFPEADFLLSAGDQVNTASNEQQYAGYLEHDALKSLPMATVIGNHDSSSNSYSQHFNNPNETTYGATTAGVDYWYVYNNTLFMIVNSNNMSAAEHKTFMEEAIAANPDVDWKIVSFHHSLYTVASHAYDNDILARRDQWVPILDELDVDVVLMGHDHVYARTYIMDGFTPEVTETVENSTTNPDGILYITANSASGSKFYGIKNETFDYAAVQSQERVPNISNVEVTENSFKITTYRTSDMSVVDTFEIIHEEESGKGDTPATSTDTNKNTNTNTETTSNSSSDDSAANTTTVTVTAKTTVQIPELQTPLSGTLADGIQYEAVNLEKGGKLKTALLQKYFGKHMYLMVFADAGVGFSIDTASIGTDVKDVALQSKLEKLPEFAQGFDTVKVTAVKEAVLPFNMAVHVNVGNENIGKTAYIFKKSLVTGAYELGKTMTVNEIGNVALETNEFTDIMILVAK